MPLKHFAASALYLVLLLPPTPAPAAEYTIYFKASPRLESIRPLAEPAAISILVTASDGRPVQDGWVDLALDAPQPGGWFSTDFPLVEGSRLVTMRLGLTRGKAEWRYLFPIRGEYRLTVAFATSQGKQASEVFVFNIREDRKKWLFLGGFTGALFAFGFVAGRIFTPIRHHTSGRVAVLIGFAAAAGGQTAAAWAQAELSGRLDVEPAVVGRPALVRWRLDHDATTPNSRAALTLTITHLEKGMTVFAVEKLAVGEEFLLNFHFTDGAEYRLRAVAERPRGRPAHTEQVVSVASVEPPQSAIVPAIVLFVAAIAAGLAAGRYSRTRRY